MISPLQILAVSCFSCLVLITAGCGTGSGGPELFQAGGTVVYKGSPVSEATVVFAPKSTGGGPSRSLQVVTDAEGQFDLFTAAIDGKRYLPGAPAGEYAVTITKVLVSTSGAKASVKHLLPKKYSEPGASNLSATVSPDGSNEFQFALQD